MLGVDRTGDVPDSTEAGVIPCFLEKLGDQFDVTGLLNFQFATPTPVMMGADTGLEHSGYQGGAGGRADRGGDRCVGEAHSVFTQPVNNRGFHQGLSIETVVLGLVLDHDPQDVWQWPGDHGREGSKK